MRRKSKDDLDLFMDIKLFKLFSLRKFHSMDAETFYISLPKPILRRSIAGIVKPSKYL